MGFLGFLCKKSFYNKKASFSFKPAVSAASGCAGCRIKSGMTAWDTSII